MSTDDPKTTAKHGVADPTADPSAQEDESDVEGHSLFGAEYGRLVANERGREAAQWARQEAARKPAQRKR